MKLIYIIVITLIFILPARSKAQATVNGTIKGRVGDIQKKALPFATILLKNTSDSSQYQSALSNDAGGFSFVNVKEGNYMVEITMMGFEKLQQTNLQINAAHWDINLGTIILKASSQMLGGVTIKGEIPLTEHQIDKTVVNVDQRITSTGSTVLELMKKLPGVQVSSDGQISLNGKSGVNVYIDGKSTYLSAQDLANLLGGMPSSNIRQIEIMTNPSAKYNAAGTSGIINIIKKKNNREGFNGGVNGSVGQAYYRQYNGGLTLSYKTEKYNLILNNSYVYNKSFYTRNTTNDILNNDNSLLNEQVSAAREAQGSRSYTPSLGLDIYLSKKNTLSLTGNAGLRNSDDETTSGMDVLDGNRIKTGNEDFNASNKDKSYNYTAGIALSHQLDTAGKEFSVDFDYSAYRNKPGQYNHTVFNDAPGNYLSRADVFLDESRQLNIYAAKADYTQPLIGNGKLETGLKSSYVKVDNDNTYYNQTMGQNLVDPLQSDYSVNTENINAAYINLNKTFKKLSVEAGLRGEQTVAKGRQKLAGEAVDQNYFQLFPTTFVDYKLNDQNTLNLKLGRRTERADYHEMVPFRRPLTPTIFFEGNPSLKPQLTWHGELTWAWHSMLFITAGYDIDHDFVRTLPYLDSNKVTITRIPTNIQGSHSWDVDITFTKKLTAWWSTDNTVTTYQNSFSGQVKGFSLNSGGITSVDFTANNSFTLSNTLSAAWDFEYESKRQFISSTFGAYSTLSFGLKQQLFNGKGSISINANNVLQTEDRNAIDRYENLNQFSYAHFYTRALRLNFNWRFGAGKVVKMKNQSGPSEEQKRAGS